MIAASLFARGGNYRPTLDGDNRGGTEMVDFRRELKQCARLAHGFWTGVIRSNASISDGNARVHFDSDTDLHPDPDLDPDRAGPHP